jgi:hypothetical protein
MWKALLGITEGLLTSNGNVLGTSREATGASASAFSN